MKSNSKRRHDSEADARFASRRPSSLLPSPHHFRVRISSARPKLGSGRGCPLLGGGTRGCQDASSCGEVARTAATQNTPLSPGVPGATAVRSGLWRREADAHASPLSIVPLFVRVCELLFFFFNSSYCFLKFALLLQVADLDFSLFCLFFS